MLPLKRVVCTRLGSKGQTRAFSPSSVRRLYHPDELQGRDTCPPGCYCPGDMDVRIRRVLGRPWVGVRVCHLLLLFVFISRCFFKSNAEDFQTEWWLLVELNEHISNMNFKLYLHTIKFIRYNKFQRSV